MTALAHLHIEAANGPLSNKCVDRGIISFQSFIEWVEQLPYRRNSNRSDYSLVFDEECGACSTKNALVRSVAIENGWDEVKLYLGLFLMSEKTNPGLDKILNQYGLESIPEAHTYLKINGEVRDVTGLDEGDESFIKSLQAELEIQPNQIGDFKVEWHQEAMVKAATELGRTFDEMWAVREACILALAGM